MRHRHRKPHRLTPQQASALQPARLPEGTRIRLTRKDQQAVTKARASMQAFDELPPLFRSYAAHYPRSVNGRSLANILDSAGGDPALACELLDDMLPARR